MNRKYKKSKKIIFNNMMIKNGRKIRLVTLRAELTTDMVLHAPGWRSTASP